LCVCIKGDNLYKNIKIDQEEYNKGLVDSAPLLFPCIKGDILYKNIKIDQEEYNKGLADCQKALRGRLVLNKGDKPYTARYLISRLSTIWKTIGKWKMVYLGRGFYDFFLTLMMIYVRFR